MGEIERVSDISIDEDPIELWIIMIRFASDGLKNCHKVRVLGHESLDAGRESSRYKYGKIWSHYGVC